MFLSKIAKKLSDPSVSSKTYWSILKSFLTGKKIPCIPSFFMKTNLLLADFREKAELFNSLFANQCSLIKKTSVFRYFLLTVKVLQINPYLTLPLLTTTLRK